MKKNRNKRKKNLPDLKTELVRPAVINEAEAEASEALCEEFSLAGRGYAFPLRWHS